MLYILEFYYYCLISAISQINQWICSGLELSTDVYWIKLHQVTMPGSKRKLDEFVFIGIGCKSLMPLTQSRLPRLAKWKTGRGKPFKDVDSEALAPAPSTTVSHSPQLLQSCQRFNQVLNIQKLLFKKPRIDNRRRIYLFGSLNEVSSPLMKNGNLQGNAFVNANAF
ncbi:hypothetical protein Leryth_023856 [Lithospermum erythrorhizon]|nr:hypothetical protein Leryth_023856 [Lithospermum erythrorhizon]